MWRFPSVSVQSRARWALLCLLAGVWTACSDEPGAATGTGPVDATVDSAGPNWGSTDAASSYTDVKPGADATPDLGVADVPRDESSATDLTDAEAGTDNDAASDVGSTCSAPCAQHSDCAPLVGCVEPLCVAGCCASQPLAAGAPCDDGDPCTLATDCTGSVCAGGTYDLCDDGKDCTIDSCKPGVGCEHTIDSDSCLIDGTCVGLAEFATNSVCLACEPTATATDWTSQPGCCKADSDCPPPATDCEIVTCDKVSGSCEVTKKIGCCDVDADCNDGDRCTVDTCDTATAGCTYTPKDCSDPSICEIGVCLPESGLCGGQIKSGYCKIDGSCRLQGNVPDDNPCLVCNPYTSKDAWSINSGIACDDGSSCTFSDSCSTEGVCTGKGLGGCCDKDSDCPGSEDPCIQPKCNALTKMCVQTTDPTCCTDGLCCNPDTNKVAAYGTPCSDQTLDQQYQCQDGDVFQRWKRPACDGSGKDACSGSLEAWTEWVLLSDCVTGTVCDDPGNGLQPTCVVAGTCNGSCGGQSSNGACSCEPSCLTTGTCCTDYKALCGCTSGDCCDLTLGVWRTPGTICGEDVVQYRCDANTLQTRSGKGKCTGDGLCDPAAATYGEWGFHDDCAGKKCKAAADGSSGTCAEPPVGTCNGHCGGQSASACWCDAYCATLGDCCTDFAAQGCESVQTCGDLSGVKFGSCLDSCGGGGLFGGCYCDAICDNIGDCCPDKAECGCY